MIVDFFRFFSLVLMVFFTPYVWSKNINFITLDVEPWAYYDEKNKKISGVFSDVIKEIENRTGYKIVMSLSSHAFSRINRELESGRQDCTMIISSDERKKISILGEKVFDLPMGILARKGVSIKSEKGFNTITVSIMSILSDRKGFLDKDDFLRQVDSTYNIGLKKLMHGRVDAVVGAIPTLNFLAKKNKMESFLQSPLIISNEPIYLQCSKKWNGGAYFNHLNNVILNMRNDGFLDSVIDKHSWR